MDAKQFNIDQIHKLNISEFADALSSEEKKQLLISLKGFVDEQRELHDRVRDEIFMFIGEPKADDILEESHGSHTIELVEDLIDYLE